MKGHRDKEGTFRLVPDKREQTRIIAVHDDLVTLAHNSGGELQKAYREAQNALAYVLCEIVPEWPYNIESKSE